MSVCLMPASDDMSTCYNNNLWFRISAFKKTFSSCYCPQLFSLTTLWNLTMVKSAFTAKQIIKLCLVTDKATSEAPPKKANQRVAIGARGLLPEDWAGLRCCLFVDVCWHYTFTLLPILTNYTQSMPTGTLPVPQPGRGSCQIQSGFKPRRQPHNYTPHFAFFPASSTGIKRNKNIHSVSQRKLYLATFE